MFELNVYWKDRWKEDDPDSYVIPVRSWIVPMCQPFISVKTEKYSIHAPLKSTIPWIVHPDTDQVLVCKESWDFVFEQLSEILIASNVQLNFGGKCLYVPLPAHPVIQSVKWKGFLVNLSSVQPLRT